MKTKKLTALILLALAQGALANQVEPSTATAPAPPAAFDCQTSWQTTQAASDRAEQLASVKRWQEAHELFREAAAGIQSVTDNCPALSKDAAALSARMAPSFSLSQKGVAHQAVCQPAIDRALNTDMKITTARQSATQPRDMDPLLVESESAWQEAATGCSSPHRERAERNLKAARKARTENAELLATSPACDTSWKNAIGMTDAAKDARKAKRWEDAATLYGKAHMAWEQAAEKCEGSRQQTASRRVTETEIDAFNAEFCGPAWDEAAEASQALAKAKAAATPLAERDQLSIRAEVAWRDTVLLCRGDSQGVAKTNADALSRERGAPLPPAAASQIGTKRQAPTYEPAGIAVAAKSPTIEIAQPPAAAQQDNKAAVVAAASATPVAPAATSKVEAKPLPANQPVELNLEGVIYRGMFHSANGQVSGNGKIVWPDGQTYAGTLVDGKRSGKGKQTWPNGQWYDGEWKNHEATGHGVMFFPDGNRYEGSVLNSVMHGKGTLLFANGDRYNGEFVQGQFHGTGTYTWKSGTFYAGEWKNGMKDGHGKMTQTNGMVSEGTYKANEETADVRQYKLTQNQ